MLLLAFKTSYSTRPIDFEDNYTPTQLSRNLLTEADNLYLIENYLEALNIYTVLLEQKGMKKTAILKKMALSHAALNNSVEAVTYTEKYLHDEFNTSFLMNDGFKGIRDSEAFKNISLKYEPRLSIWAFMYFYVALIGFYIAVMITLNKKTDGIARILISSFIFIHSFFILHICLNITNYHFEYPHSYLMSTSFSFLYGPLLYFYLKRITQQYHFRKTDLLHLVPTVLFFLYSVPIYAMSADDKLGLMLDRAIQGYNSENSNVLIIIVSLKLISLIVYGVFIRRLYLKSEGRKALRVENKIWQKNICQIHFLYIFSYAIYGVLISIDISSGFFYHIQIICMSLMVLYVGYSANVQYNVFNGLYSFDNRSFFKYEKSGLTESLSHELKESLIYLFDSEKIYKENDINLEILAEKLNTTRHNTSQVINEHFKVSFHELVNTYRIQEAKKILNSDKQKNLNIIDIAYEVGYNNKVTFNKAFKRDTQLTPSQYQRVSIRT